MSTARPLTLYERFARIPDPRSAQGLRHPLPAMLTQLTVALMAGCGGYEAVAQFGRQRGAAFAKALGYTRRKTPAKSSFCEVLQVLDVHALGGVIRDFLVAQLGLGAEHAALDGKTLRGTAQGDQPAIHVLNLYCPAVQQVVDQFLVDHKTNEHKAALRLLKILPPEIKVLTADAMFCQRDFCAEALAQQRDYVVYVKENQPGLLADIRTALDRPAENRALSPLATGA